MNEAIYKMADSGGSIRIVVQKKPGGGYLVGTSNGRDRPLICQGTREEADAEFESTLPVYQEELKNIAIETKLRTAEAPPVADGGEEVKEGAHAMPAAATSPTEEQPELDFGF